jgi:tRNA A37 N6-isopentenylltransferase MiaA
LAVAAGQCTVPQAMALTETRTRQLARRQLTWFRHQARVSWVNTAEVAAPASQADEVMKVWETNGPAALHI